MERRQKDENEKSDSKGLTLEEIFELDDEIRDPQNREATY